MVFNSCLLPIKTYKISAVSYTNTKPFVFGIYQTNLITTIDLSLDIPSLCAEKVLNDEVDIGLVPVATLLGNMNLLTIISCYGICATGVVNSVFLLSNKPVQHIHTVRLDTHSQTSNLLLKVLLKYFWKLSVEFVDSEINEVDASVLIGDRTFGETKNYEFVYDLSQIWQEFTQLPFVFAVWVANKYIEQSFVEQFNCALSVGIANIASVIKDHEKTVDNFDIADYLVNKIQYHISEKHEEGMQLFLKLASTL